MENARNVIFSPSLAGKGVGVSLCDDNCVGARGILVAVVAGVFVLCT